MAEQQPCSAQGLWEPARGCATAAGGSSQSKVAQASPQYLLSPCPWLGAGHPSVCAGTGCCLPRQAEHREVSHGSLQLLFCYRAPGGVQGHGNGSPEDTFSGAEFMAGLGDLRTLLHPHQFCDSMVKFVKLTRLEIVCCFIIFKIMC